MADRLRSVTTELGTYDAVCQLARGGMAELVLARAHGGDELVVLKRILPEFAANPRFVKLFLDEARLVAGLDHPNIARVIDFGLVDDDYVLVMEYVHGKDVRSTLRRTAQRNQELPIASAIEIAHAVAAALHHAHEHRQAIHRDVSPSNIVIAYEGSVKLVDFGVAKAADSSVETRTGTLKGKVQYMSPEQARGASLDRRSDVFSLGIVLWEMITTRRLFQANNDLAAIQQILHSRAPRPSTLRAACPPELDRITAKALAPDAGARYQTADELARDLADLATRLAAPSRSLRAHMHQLFEPEITAWKEAQEAGLTLVDHVVATGADMVTPASDRELELDDEPLVTLAEVIELDETTGHLPPDLDGLDDATSYYTPTPRARSATGSTPVVRVIRHSSVAPVVADVTTYPSVTSDPSYASISRELRPEPRSLPRRAVVWVLVLAVLAGIALAVGSP